MVSKILMPSGGQTTDELVILQWNKKVGDFVKRGDILFEIETDKAILTVESFAEGTLLEISYPEGSMVKTGETVAYIGEPGDMVPNNAKESPATPEPAVQEVVRPEHQPSAPVNGGTQRPAPVKDENRIYASPLAKSQARAQNIRLEDVAKHVAKNLIRKDDIKTYLDHIANGRKAGEDDFDLIEATPMRKTIAKRMRDSLTTSPHYTVSADIDMTEMISFRQKLNSSLTGEDVKITYNDLLMKVVAKAIKHHPLVNASWTDDKIKVHRNVHAGLAIAVDGGLLVPVTRNVNTRSLLDIAQSNAANITKARTGKVNESDINGGTITISNLGMYGMKEFTAVINQPETCILAVGAILEKPVAVNRVVVVRDIMNITASFDHRVIDGATGAAFLAEVKRLLENPHLLAL